MFDFDKEGSENFYLIKSKDTNWDDKILGNLKSGFYKKRNQHPCFYALLLPIPDSLKSLISDITKGEYTNYIEVENLLPEKFLKDNNFCVEKTVLTQKYLKICNDKKDKIWKKLINLQKDDFSNFQPLFQKIKEVFDS